MRLLDSNFRPYGEIDESQYRSSTWHVEWYDYGKFELRMPKKFYDANMKYILNTDINEVAMITSISRDNYDIVIKGKLLLFMLNDYVIHETVNYTNQTSEYIAKDLVRRFGPPNLQIEQTTLGLGKVIDTLQVTGENLGDYILELLEEQELSPHIDFDYVIGQIKFTVREGADNIIKKPPLSYSFDTMQEYEYEWDREDYRNYAYVAGEEKENEARVIVEVDARKDPDEPKRELWVDARSTRSTDLTADQYKEALTQKGLEKLKRYEIDELIDITPAVIMPPGAEFELGEKRLFIDSDLFSEQRITGILYGYEDGCVKKSIMFGNQNLLKNKKIS